MKTLCLIFFFCHLSFSIHPFEVPKTCLENQEYNDCENCNKNKSKQGPVNSLVKISNQISNPSLNLEVYESTAKSLKIGNIIQKNKLASLFRSLRDGESEPSYKTALPEINKIENDFKKLTILSKEANHLERKFNICMFNCSAYRKLELSDEIKKIQKLKIALLIGQPILSNKNFEKRFLDMKDSFADSEEEFSRTEFESSLKDALFENLQVLLKKNDEYDHLEYDFKKPIIKNSTPKDIKNYNEELISRYPLISHDIVNDLLRFDSKSSNKQSACYFAQEYNHYSKRKEYKELAIEVGLFALPLALGPVGRIGELSAELVMGEKLLNWGLKGKEVATVLKITDFSFQVGRVGHEIGSIYEKMQQCQEAEVIFLNHADSEKLEITDQCKKDLSNKIFLSELSSISLATTSIAPKALSLLKSMSLPKPKTPETIGLLLKDFGGGKNKVIKAEINSMILSAKKEGQTFSKLSTVSKDKKADIENFISRNNIESEKLIPNIIPKSSLADFEKSIGKDTIELLYIPGSEIPFLPNAVNKVGHVAIRIGNKVYHQTGGSGFRIETFDNFINQTKKEYKVFGQVMQVSEKEKAVMESFFQKMYDKQLPYSFLVNNCSQAVCRAMKLADFEKKSVPLITHDPIALVNQVNRNERVVMKTLYNADKDLTTEQLKKATVNNRLAFYGVPAVAAGAAATGTYQAVDFVIEYLNQIRSSDKL